MEKVNEILLRYPDTTEVSLEQCGLKTLDDILVGLSKLKQLKVLRLSNNFLKTLPSDLSCLSRLEYLDLRNNQFDDVEELLSGLFSLPTLKHLYVTMDEQDEDEIIISLTNLESFNGTPLTDLPDTEPSSQTQRSPNKKRSKALESPKISERIVQESITESQQANNTVPLVEGSIFTMNDFKDVQRLHDAIGLYLGSRLPFDPLTIPSLQNLLQPAKDNQSVYNLRNSMLLSKKQAFDSLFEDVIDKVSEVDKKAASILMIVKNSYSDLSDTYHSLLESVIKECFGKMYKLQKDLDQADKDISQLLLEAEHTQKIAKEGETAKNKALIQNELEKERFTEEIGFLKSEIEKYKNRLNQLHVHRQKISTQVTQSPKKILLEQNKSTKEIKSTKLKPLSLKQMKDLIEEVYNSKTKFDQKCLESKLPRETMEQHLFTYLNQKYGLKGLVYEWVSAVNFAVKRFSEEENDVKVFGKLLRNELDEEFRFVQKQLKETAIELLKAFLRAKYNKKMDHDIQIMIQNRLNGDLFEEEWVDIIKYLYNKEDSVTVIILINEAILKIRHTTQNSIVNTSTLNKTSNTDTKNKVSFKLFLEVVLNFQLDTHEKFISSCLHIFREFDTNKDGILSNAELRMFLEKVDSTKNQNDIEHAIETLDPHNNNQVTFSQCVTYLSTELMKNADPSSLYLQGERDLDEDYLSDGK